MSFNLVSIISEFLPKEAIDRIASALGISPAVAQSVVNAAIPSVLGSLGSVAATPSGADRIAAQLQSQEPSMLEGLWSGLGGNEQHDISTYGTNMLSGLLGGAGPTNMLSGALAKFTGAPADKTNSILGIIAPVAMGAIANQAPQATASGSALSQLFASQQNIIQSAMPAGLAASLGGILGGFAPSNAVNSAVNSANAAVNSATQGVRDAAANATATADNAARTIGAGVQNTANAATNAVRNAEQRVETAASGMPGWLLPVLGVLVLLAIGWYFMSRSDKQATVPPAAPVTNQIARDDAVATFTKDANATFGNLTQTLTTITNVDSAKAALPKLTEAEAQLGKLQASLAAMPEATRKTAATQLTGLVGTLKAAIEKALAIPGVGDVLKPAVTPILARLDTLAKG